jgi:hypothetical protein
MIKYSHGIQEIRMIKDCHKQLEFLACALRTMKLGVPAVTELSYNFEREYQEDL